MSRQPKPHAAAVRAAHKNLGFEIDEDVMIAANNITSEYDPLVKAARTVVAQHCNSYHCDDCGGDSGQHALICPIGILAAEVERVEKG